LRFVARAGIIVLFGRSRIRGEVVPPDRADNKIKMGMQLVVLSMTGSIAMVGAQENESFGLSSTHRRY
jgi:hypothetical protein